MKSILPQLRTFILFSVFLAVTDWTGATTFVWNVPSPGGDNNWNVNANWLPATGNPGAGDTAVFGTTGTNASSTTVNNIVSVNTTVTSLFYNHTTNGTFHVTSIPTGVTLTVSGVFTNGGLVADSVTTKTFMTGGGSFVANGASFVIGNNGSSGADQGTILDLSGLSNFVYNASGGTLTMATGNRSGADFKLAATNVITTATWNHNTASTSSSASGTLTLGSVTNTINVGTFNIGAARENATVTFGTTGGLRLRGVGGTDTDRATMVVANRSSGNSSATSSSGTLSLNGHPIDVKVSTLTLGENTQNANPQITINGILSFNQGTFDVTTVIMALVSSGNTQFSNVVNSTISVGSAGTLLVGNGGISLLNNLGTGVSNALTGTLIITNGGTVTSSGSIVKSSLVGTGTITISNGTLNMISGTVGTPGIPIDTLNLAGGTLKLSLNGSAPVTNIVAATVVTNGGVTTISIGSVANVAIPTTFALIGYAGTDPFGNLVLAPLPNGFTGTLVDDAGKIDLNVTPPTAGPSLVWVGATNSVLTSSWDTTTPNWLDAATLTTPQVYADLDPVRFDDRASNNVVTLTANVAPFNILVTNNALNYTFNGTGKISGPTSLVKNGPGTLTLTESGGDSFNGGIIVSNGTLVLDNVNSTISGGLNLVAGTVQVGNNDANGNLPNGTIADNGSLIFNRTDNLTMSTAITGTGSVTKNANSTLTLSVNNGFTGGLTANGGTVRLSTIGAPGSGTITANTGGAVVLSALSSNNIVLSGGILGSSANLTPLTNDLTATAGTTSWIYCADPQNLTPTDCNEMGWSNVWHGSGTVIVATVTNDSSADSGNGFRLRGTNVSDFSGIIIFSNNVKGELQTVTAGPFSPVGTGKIGMVCGIAYLTNATTEPGIGGYSELNFRNNSASDTTFGNDMVFLGSGLAILNPLGTATGGTKITMGNLTIGGGQELGIYLSANPSHVTVFPTVTLTGGTVRFSPKTPGFGATTSVGGDLSLGNISEQSPSGIIMAGLANLILTGTNTYTGNTTINSGRLALTGYGSISNTPAVTIASGATFDVSGLTNVPFILNAGQTLSGSGTVAGTLAVAGGSTLRAGSTTTIGTLTNTGSTLMLGGGTFVVKVQNATNGPGLGNDSLAVSTNIGLLSTIGSKFTIKLVSLGGTGAAGNVTNFDNTANYTWTIATGAVTNFNANAFTLDTSGFTNPLGGGQFFVGSTGSSLVLLFKTAGSVAGAGGSISNPTLNGGGNPTFSGHGIPGYIYGVESSTASVNGPWVNAGPDQASSTVTAGADGSWSFTDANQTNPPLIFYRLYYPYSATPPQ